MRITMLATKENPWFGLARIRSNGITASKWAIFPVGLHKRGDKRIVKSECYSNDPRRNKTKKLERTGDTWIKQVSTVNKKKLRENPKRSGQPGLVIASSVQPY